MVLEVFPTGRRGIIRSTAGAGYWRSVGQTVGTVEIWTTYFPRLAPVGHVLRKALPNRWLRIHSLPQSKRYPESDLDYSELLTRHYSVAREILGEGGDALLFVHAYGIEKDLREAYGDVAWAHGLRLDEVPVTTFPPVGGEDMPITTAGCSIRWASGAWDALLRDVAEWRFPSVVLLNPESGEVYAPYDGGADTLLADSNRVEALKIQWAAWLSTHPNGL